MNKIYLSPNKKIRNSPHKIVTDIMNEVDLGIRWEIDNLCHNSQRMIDMMSHQINNKFAIYYSNKT